MTFAPRWMMMALLSLLPLAWACGGDDDDDDDTAPTANDDDDDVSLPACPLPSFDAENAYDTHEVTYSSPGGVDLLASIHVPKGEGPFTTIMLIHGGAWIMNDRTLMAKPAHYYASHGMVVMNIEYRLAPGTKMDGIGRDCSCALRWMIQHAAEYKGDGECVGILGESAGGHLTALTALDGDNPKYDYDCEEASEAEALARFAMPYYGILDVAAFLDAMPGMETILPTLIAEGDDVINYDPAQFVEQHPEIPFFMGHGDADEQVPVGQSPLFKGLLEAAGHEAEVVIVEGAPHGFVAGGFDGEFNAVAQPQAEAWLMRILAGE